MAKIYERFLSTIKLRENRRDSFDPQRENLLGEDGICMVNLKGNCGVKSAYFGVRGLWCTFQFLIKYLACGLCERRYCT